MSYNIKSRKQILTLRGVYIHEVSLAIAIAAFEQNYKNILIDINAKDRQGLRDRQLPFKIFAMMQQNC